MVPRAQLADEGEFPYAGGRGHRHVVLEDDTPPRFVPDHADGAQLHARVGSHEARKLFELGFDLGGIKREAGLRQIGVRGNTKRIDNRNGGR